MHLTSYQEDILLDQILRSGDPLYNIGGRIEVDGPLDYSLLTRAYNDLINQSDACRTIFGFINGEFVAEVRSNYEAPLKCLDLSAFEDNGARAVEFMESEMLVPFDIFADAWLFKCTLIKLNGTKHFIFFVYHHLIMDGWSTALMYRRLIDNYNSLLTHGRVSEHPIYSYSDFISDDHAYRNSGNYATDQQYWLRRLKDLPDQLFSMEDIEKSKTSDRMGFSIPCNDYAALEALAEQQNVSVFHVLLTGFICYFSKRLGKPELVVGLPVLNRSTPQFKQTPGLFAGVTPLRVHIDMNNSFIDVLQKIKHHLRSDYRHQRFPLGGIIRHLPGMQKSARLFDLRFSYEKHDYSPCFLNTQTSIVAMSNKSESLPLAIYVRHYDHRQGGKIELEYNLGYIDNAEVGRISAHILNFFSNILLSPSEKLKDIAYLTKRETQTILLDFNSTETKIPRGVNLISMFREKAESFPNSIAVRDRQKEYSYSEVEDASDRVCNYIVENHGCFINDPIAVLYSRSAVLIPLLLGILKSGHPYIPIDRSLPRKRIEYILGQSQPALLISDSPEDMFSGLANVHNISEALFSAPYDKASKNVNPAQTDTAYIIYTSGSTGSPKGVAVSHLSLTNFLWSMRSRLEIGPGDILYSVTTFSFDISILEYFLPLVAGATTYIASPEMLIAPEHIIGELKEIQPSYIQATPSFFQMLYESDWPGDSHLTVLCGGEALSRSLAGRLLRTNFKVLNLYGPTETTIWSSLKRIIDEKDHLNIGKPLDNTQIYILDKDFNILPLNTAGNLFIGGHGVAKGYYKDQELTNTRFIENPHSLGNLMYDTGDIAKWNANGEVIYLGRMDSQFKIRGFRVEGAEIENCAHLLHGIKAAVVTTRQCASGEKELILFVTSHSQTLTIKTIYDHLRRHLPFFMIPAYIQILENIPLMPNGKLDRMAISAMDTTVVPEPSSRSSIKRSESLMESIVRSAWEKAFNRPLDDPNSDFFELGGHSLMAARLVADLSIKLSTDIKIQQLYKNPTITLLSGALQRGRYEDISIEKASMEERYPLSGSQYRIWLALQATDCATAYNLFGVYKIHGRLDIEQCSRAIKELIDENEVLRSNFILDGPLPVQAVRPVENTWFKVETGNIKQWEVADRLLMLSSCQFDLENDLLLRVNVLNVEDSKSLFVFMTHHLIMDGWSLELFFRQFVLLYNKLPHDTPKYQFRDYIHTTILNQRKSTQIHNFWAKYLQNYTLFPLLKHDSTQSACYKNQAEARCITLKDATYRSCMNMILRSHVTSGAFFLAVLKTIIFRITGIDDIAVAVAFSGRQNQLFQNQLGMFMQTLIVRSKIEETRTILDLSHQVQENILHVQENQELPEHVNISQYADIIFLIQNPFSVTDILTVSEDTSLELVRQRETYAKFPLSFSVQDYSTHLEIEIVYDSGVYAESTIRFIIQKIESFFVKFEENCSTSIKSIQLSTELEKKSRVDFDFPL